MNELKDFNRCKKKVLGFIDLNLFHTSFAHVISQKCAIGAWKTLCNVYESRNLSNVVWSREKLFTVKMEEDGHLMVHVNKVRALANQHNGVQKPLHEVDVVMTLLSSHLDSYSSIIVALESVSMKDLTRS
jgi:hypothetical protein